MKKHIEDTYGYKVIDLGTDSTESFDYPIAGEAVANCVAGGRADLGIVICGTGIGISLAANKVRGIRCAVCSEPVSARLAREHNNANIVAMGARTIGPVMAEGIVDTFLTTDFLGGRHQMRVDMITAIENGETL